MKIIILKSFSEINKVLKYSPIERETKNETISPPFVEREREREKKRVDAEKFSARETKMT